MQASQVLLVIEGTYPWYRGGVSEWVAQYLKAFSDVEFTILQIATDQYRDARLDEAVYRVPPNIKKFMRTAPPEIEKSPLQRLDVWGEQTQESFNCDWANICDCVHVANTGFAGWLGMSIARKYDKPLILTEHAIYWKEIEEGAVALECGYKIPQARADKKAMVKLFQRIAKKVYLNSDQVISVSKCNIQEQQKLGALDVNYIPNGVDDSWITEQKQYSDKLTAGWIGRCAAMKNPLKFIEIAKVFGDWARCIMMLCDADEDQLKREVCKKAEPVSNLQLVWNRPAKEHIDKMDALCITSLNESQPLVLFEALSRQVLPVGCSVGDVTDKFALIQHDPKPAALVENVLKLWSDKEQWSQEIQSRFERLKDNHTWSSVFRSYRQVLNPYLGWNLK